MQIQMLDDGGDLRHELHRRGAGPHDAHPFAGQIEAVLPTRRMEDLAAEVLQSGKGRNRRLAQGTGRPDEHRRAILLAAGRADDPVCRGVVPARLVDGPVQAQIPTDVEAVDAVA